MAEALAEAQRQSDATTAQLQRSVDELGASVDRVIRENEALQDELVRARADLATAANVDRELRDELDDARHLVEAGDAQIAALQQSLADTARKGMADRRIAMEEISKRDAWNVELLGALRVVIEEGDKVQAASLPVAELRHHMRVAWLAAKRAFPGGGP